MRVFELFEAPLGGKGVWMFGGILREGTSRINPAGVTTDVVL